MDYELKEFDLNSIAEIEGDENYFMFLDNLREFEKKGFTEKMQGVYMAYQNGKIVYVGNRKIENGLELTIQKVISIVHNAPMLIVKIGETNVAYFYEESDINKIPKI